MTVRADIEQRLRDHDQAQAEPLFREVAGASDLNSLIEGRAEAGGVYVFRLAAAAGPNQSATGVVQARTDHFAIVTVTDSGRDRLGADASDAEEARLARIESALLNWVPSGARRGLEYAGGKLVSMRAGRRYWQDVYRLPGSQVRQIGAPA